MRSPPRPRSARSRRSEVWISRPTGIFPGGNVFQTPPPAVEASESSVTTGGVGEAPGGAATGEAAAMTGEAAATGVEVGRTFGGGGQRGTDGVVCATTTGVGVGLAFLFFASFPFGVAVAFGGGDAAATIGASIC